MREIPPDDTWPDGENRMSNGPGPPVFAGWVNPIPGRAVWTRHCVMSMAMSLGSCRTGSPTDRPGLAVEHMRMVVNGVGGNGWSRCSL